MASHAWPLLGIVAALMLGACGRKDDALASCQLPAGGTVLAIGDSLTRGYGADGQGYAEQLQDLLAGPAGKPDVTVLNLGIDGEHSAGLLARIDGVLAEHRPAVVLITTGGNDFLRRVAEDETRRNLGTVVDRVRQGGAFPIVFAIPRPSLAAAAGVVSEHALYADLAGAATAHVIGDVVTDVLSRDDLRSDQIHPNQRGYQVMAQAAFEVLSRCR